MVTVNLRSLLLAVTCAAGIVAGAAETASSFELVDISATISTNWKFSGAAVAGDGRVVFAPHFADVVGVFNPGLERCTCCESKMMKRGFNVNRGCVAMNV